MALIFAFGALLAFAAPAGAAVVGHNLRSHRAFLAAGMQPEVVARTLMNVEQEWKAQAGIFVECSSAGEGGDSVVDCNDAPKAFARSCATVVSAVVQGSGGDKDTVKEYMEDVCGQNALSGWQKAGCMDLGAAIEKSMTADNYENRNNFDASPPCSSFWSRVLETEKVRAAKEEAERKEAEKKAAEEAAEAAKKAKEEAEAEAKAEAERQMAEAERKKAEEADRKKKEAEEAASRVAEAAKRVEEKKAEAEAAAKAAREKMEEAAKVEKEHHDLLAKANVTQAAVPTQPEKAIVSTLAPENASTPVLASGNITVNVTAEAAVKKFNTTPH